MYKNIYPWTNGVGSQFAHARTLYNAHTLWHPHVSQLGVYDITAHPASTLPSIFLEQE